MTAPALLFGGAGQQQLVKHGVVTAVVNPALRLSSQRLVLPPLDLAGVHPAGSGAHTRCCGRGAAARAGAGGGQWAAWGCTAGWCLTRTADQAVGSREVLHVGTCVQGCQPDVFLGTNPFYPCCACCAVQGSGRHLILIGPVMFCVFDIFLLISVAALAIAQASQARRRGDVGWERVVLATCAFLLVSLAALAIAQALQVRT